MPKIIINERVFVPKILVKLSRLRQYYSIPLYNDSGCNRCNIFKDGLRHSKDDCDNCINFKGNIKLWNKTKINNKTYYGLPNGRMKLLEKQLRISLADAKDLRPIIPLSHPIKFVRPLYTGQIVDGRPTVDQEKIVKKWLKKKTGIIKSPARSGKSAIATKIICELGVKTLIVANQDRHLRQFIRAFKGAPGYINFTNIEQVEKKLGRPLIGIVEKVSDLAKFDIACLTYQKFIRKDAQKKINKWIRDKFCFLITDEVHRSGAMKYGQFISRLNCKYKLGLSATVERKDGASLLIKEHIGDVVAKSNIIGLAPKIEIVETGITSKYDYRSWMPAMGFLANNIDRKRLIVREVFKDLADGHAIIIAVDLVKQVSDLVHLINTTAVYQNENHDKTWPEIVAKPYVRTNLTKKRSNTNDEMTAVLDDFDSGKFKVLVAMRSMIKENIDLASPTRLYMLVPTSASSATTDLEPSGKIGSPNFQQLAFRISTFTIGKPQPVVKLFVDGIPQSYRCFISLFWHEILPNLRRYENAPPRYKMDDITLQRAMQLAKDFNYVPHNPPGVFISSKKAIKLSRRKVANNTKPSFQSIKKPNQVRSYEKYHLV